MTVALAGSASVLALVPASVAGAAGNGSAVAKVTVTFTDSALRVSPMTPGSGPTTFVVLNRGRKAHALFVEGPGLKNAHTSKLAAGGRATLTVKLRPGAYTLSDPAGLGEYRVVFLDVVASATLTAKGDANVSSSSDSAVGMCGVYQVAP